MDLKDQLKQLFPDHKSDPNESVPEPVAKPLQKEPIICKYEKRKGKPVTIIEGFEGDDTELKDLAKMIKTSLSVGGGIKAGSLLIQGDYRDKIMAMLKANGFNVKRVGG